MRTYKANLPEGVRKCFSASRGVKVRLVNKMYCKKSNAKTTKKAA
jgi:hypothetical protein